MTFKNAIEVRNLTKKYNKDLVVNKVSFSVSKGEIFGFLGPNGAGKTTTIRILTGLEKKTAGDIRILGQDIEKINTDFFYRIGVVFEENNLYQRLTGFQNLRLFADMYGLGRERVIELLSKFGLKNVSYKTVNKYSKGMKQRLLICRALLNEPELLILDEPTGGLDPASVAIIHQAIKDFKAEGGTVFISTHYLEEADKLCDRLAFINHGEIIAVDYPDLLKERYGTSNLEVKILNKDKQFLSRIVSLLTDDDEVIDREGFLIIRMPLNDKEIGKRLDKIRAETRIINIHSREASLHDVFISLTGSEIECN